MQPPQPARPPHLSDPELALAAGASQRPTAGNPPEQSPAAAPAPTAPWLLQMLDQIDQGLLLVRPDGELLYANPAALRALDSQHPLLRLGNGLHLHDARDVAPLLDALADAARGARRLVNLGHGPEALAVSVVPLAGPRRPDALPHLQDHPGILLVLGRRAEGAPPGLAAFAHSLGFTPTETRVLQGLYEGLRPAELGQRMGVAVSTIRTHIGSMRDKSGAGSIRELVRRVAVLPPVELDAPLCAGPAPHGSNAHRREQPPQPSQPPPTAPAGSAT